MRRTPGIQGNAFVIISTMTAFALAWVVTMFTPYPWLTWLLTPAIVVVVGLLVSYSVDQYILAFVWLGLFWIAFAISQGWGTLIGILFTSFGFYLAAISIDRSQFVGTGIRPLDYLILSFLGRLNDPVRYSTPEDTIQRTTQVDIGPRLVVVRTETAVLMARGEQDTRFMGPGRFISQPFEYVYVVIRLRPKLQRYLFNNILTKERIPQRVSISFVYGPNVRDEVRYGSADIDGVEADALRKYVDWAEGWQTDFRGIVEKSVRIAIGTQIADYVLDVMNNGRVRDHIVRVINADIVSWGLRLYELHVVAIEPDEDVVQAAEENWLTSVRNETWQRNEKARAVGWKDAIDAVSSAYRDAKKAGVPNAIFYRELFRRLMPDSTADEATRNLLLVEQERMLTRPEEPLD